MSNRNTRNRRKHERVAFRYGAAILNDNAVICICSVLDISERGARIQIDREADIPATFRLSFSRNGQVHRLCQMMWREKNELGVLFL